MLRFTRLSVIILLITSQVAHAANPQKILIVVSSYGKDGGKTRPGFEFDEFSQAYLVFKANGFAIGIASPRGGGPSRMSSTKPYNQRVLADEAAMTLLNQTRPSHALNVADYTALYVVGGKGGYVRFAVRPGPPGFHHRAL